MNLSLFKRAGLLALMQAQLCSAAINPLQPLGQANEPAETRVSARELLDAAATLKRQGLSRPEILERLYPQAKASRLSARDLRAEITRRFGVEGERLEAMSEQAASEMVALNVDPAKYGAESYQQAHPMIIPVFCVFHPVGWAVCLGGVVVLIWGAIALL
ncbi:MAG: hypothetical protein HY078_02290 [Elusimicrobia bacterium]|nr:hypothetical protein [Elusimicrobiota bacterium]